MINNTISFTSSYVDKLNILKLNKQKEYFPHQSILVELESSDLEVLNDINNKWTQNSFGDNFVCWAKYNHKRTNKLFALTTQQNNFNKLQADSILGLMNIDLRKRKSKIHYIETKPNNPEYNNVGSSLINYAKTKTNRIKLTAGSKKLVDKFYTPLGFIHEYKNNNDRYAYCELIWLKNQTILDKLKIYLKTKSRIFIEKLIDKLCNIG